MSDKPILHVGRPNMGDQGALQRRFAAILHDQWFTNNGPIVRQFESALARRCGVKHCVAVSNGTIGLELTIRALGLTGEVILPSFTFVATAHALHWHGIKPVFCDVNPVTLCIDPGKIGPLISAATSAIIGVHVYGHACDVSALEQIAAENDIALLFDAAHAVGCSHKGKCIGGFGSCEVFSFHATKILNSIEGGAITTNDDELAERLRRMRNFGFPGDGRETTVELGTNGKMNEFCAAMGLTNLASLDEFITANKTNYEAYNAGLTGIRGLRVYGFDPHEDNNFQYVILLISETEFGQSRDALLQALHAQGILARRYFSPGCHAMEPYATEYPDAFERLPVTEAICRQVLAVPTGTQLGPPEIREICEIIRAFQATG